MSHWLNDVVKMPQKNIIKFENNSETDVVLIIDDVKFHCHRDVLSLQSQYFQAMFCQNFIEKDKDAIEIKGVDSNAMFAILLSFYGKELPPLLGVHNALDILEAASMLQLNQIEKQCIDFLGKTMNPDLSLRIYQVADRLSMKSLYDKAQCYALWEFPFVKTTKAFIELPLHEIKSYLSSDHLRTNSEVEVFEAVICWIEGGQEEEKNENRLEFLSDLLYCIRFISLQAEDIRSFLLHPVVSSHQKASAILKCILFILEMNMKEDQRGSNEGVHEEGSPSKNNGLVKGMDQFDEETMTLGRQMQSVSPRHPSQVPCVVGHIGFPKSHGSSQSVNSSGQRMIKRVRTDDEDTDFRPYLLHLKESVGEDGKSVVKLVPLLSLTKISGTKEALAYRVISVGKDVILVGGKRNDGYRRCLSSIWTYRKSEEPGEEEWFRSNLNIPRWYHSVCSVGDDLYIIGGFGRHYKPLKTMERYHVPTGKCYPCRPLPKPVISPATCFFDGCIYVFSMHLFCYDPQTDSWCTIKELTLPRNVITSAMQYKDYIYLTGTHTKRLLRFSPRHRIEYQNQEGKKKLWTLEKVGFFRNKTLNTCIVGHKIYSFAHAERWRGYGSLLSNYTTPVVETYNILTETFEVIWNANSDSIKSEEGGLVYDFSSLVGHSSGCFPMTKF